MLARGLIAAVALVLGTTSPQQAESDAERRQRLEREIEWKRSTAVGSAAGGRLVNGVKLPPEGVHFDTWDPIRWQRVNRVDRRYATDRLVRTILRVARQYRAAHPDAPRLLIGDMSRPRGGSFDGRYGSLREFGTRAPSGGHVSHQNGLDADIYYPRNDRRPRAPTSVGQIDRRLAQDLVNRFVAAGAQFVFVGPRTGLRGRPGVVQQLDYHGDHLHVRLR